MRPGDNKWSMTIFARDPDTGEAKWAYQTTPHDRWDYDAVNESMPVDLPMTARRKVLLHFDRNGFVYTMDRVTGRGAPGPAVPVVNWASGYRSDHRRPKEVPAKRTHEGR